MPRGIDWVAAREHYVALGAGRSFGKVSRKFGVSDSRVSTVARRDNWLDYAAAEDRRHAAKLHAAMVRSREERDAVFLRITDTVYDQALEKLEAGELEVRLADLPALGKHTQLILGEATERMSFAEVQEALTAVIGVGVQAIREGWPVERFLVAVRERLGAVGGQGQEDAA